MTTHVEQVDIAIVGGGMVGASLACMLAASQSHWRIALIDAKPFPSASADYSFHPDARSTALSYGSVQILDKLDLWSGIAPKATAIQQVHVSDRGYFPGSRIEAAKQGFPALGYVVENSWLGQQLARRVSRMSGITCLAPAHLKHVCMLPGAAQLDIGSLVGDVSLRARLLVIADGSDSPLRQSLGIDTRIDDYQQSAIVANIETTLPHGGVAYERFTDEGPLALLPLGGSDQARRMALIWTLPTDKANVLATADTSEFLHTLQTRFGQRLGRLVQVGQREIYPLQLVTACEQVRSGVVLVGNAAHFLHPVAGQGFNLALRDCAALVETLGKAEAAGHSPGDLAVLQGYLASQSRDQAATIQLSDSLVRLFSSSSLPLIALRHLGLLSLEAVVPLKQIFVRQTLGQAGRDYRWLPEAPDMPLQAKESKP